MTQILYLSHGILQEVRFDLQNPSFVSPDFKSKVSISRHGICFEARNPVKSFTIEYNNIERVYTPNHDRRFTFVLKNEIIAGGKVFGVVVVDAQDEEVSFSGVMAFVWG